MSQELASVMGIGLGKKFVEKKSIEAHDGHHYAVVVGRRYASEKRKS